MKLKNTLAPLVCVLVGTGCAAAATQCQAIQETDRAKLIEYVQRKYKIPATVPLDVVEGAFVSGACYRELQFKSLDQRRPFQIDLIASPDFRFLTRELLDSHIDPIEEERKKETALMSDLRRDDAAAVGPKNAPVTITLFSDFQCPFCAQLANGLMKDILPGEADRVRVVFRNFPLSMHPWARAAAEAAECARAQGDKYFWSFHDYLFEHQKDLSPDNLKSKLAEYGPDLAGFDVQSFEGCVDQRKSAKKIESDLELGKRAGISATPTMFVNSTRITGFRPEQIRTLIQQLSGPEKVVGNVEPEVQPAASPACSPTRCERE